MRAAELEELSKLEEFLRRSNRTTKKVEMLQKDASSRIYYRVHMEPKAFERDTYIFMDSCQDKISLFKALRATRTFRRLGINVPEIFYYDLELGYALIEDFGPIILNKVIDDSNQEVHYKNLLDIICEIQHNSLVNKDILDLPFYTTKLLDKEALQFCNHYLRYKLIDSHVIIAQEELFEILHNLYKNLNSTGYVLVHRDFHVDNLILQECSKQKDFKVGIIDHQDAVLGSVAYDVASLLQDARRKISENFEHKMLDYFLSKSGYDRKIFMKEYYTLALQKNLKIIGIFNRLRRENGRIEYGKRCNLVWEYIERTLWGGGAELLEAKEWFAKHNLSLKNEL